MARCGCDTPDSCQCSAEAGTLGELTVAGTGTVADPFVVDNPAYQIVADKAAVDAIASPQHGWRAFATGEGEFGLRFVYTGTLWVLDGEQVLFDELLAASGEFTFDGIPDYGRNLTIKHSGRGTVAAATARLRVQFNDDAGASSYDWGELVQGVTAGQTGDAQGVVGELTGDNATANSSSGNTIEIPNYADTTFYREAHSKGGGGNQRTVLAHTAWKNTADAISKIFLFAGSGDHQAGSRATVLIS